MQRAHDLCATPSLIKPEIANDIADLLTAVSAVAGCAPAEVVGYPPATIEPPVTIENGLVALNAVASMICVVRRSSIDSVADRPLPSCAV